MITPIQAITLKDAERLRRKAYGTHGKSVCITEAEVTAMKDHLDTIYLCDVEYSFAEKICKNNKIF